MPSSAKTADALQTLAPASTGDKDAGTKTEAFRETFVDSAPRLAAGRGSLEAAACSNQGPSRSKQRRRRHKPQKRQPRPQQQAEEKELDEELRELQRQSSRERRLLQQNTAKQQQQPDYRNGLLFCKLPLRGKTKIWECPQQTVTAFPSSPSGILKDEAPKAEDSQPSSHGCNLPTQLSRVKNVLCSFATAAISEAIEQLFSDGATGAIRGHGRRAGGKNRQGSATTLEADVARAKDGPYSARDETHIRDCSHVMIKQRET
ncbi:hypothetical protein cyc_08293 [Cyclospora cayetanensis]|uniref:Uncharacterized protein n=1 Tax=Cyclospora cayetanensis TaxID=88456 RepID=A0A1D3DA41_9EIME|nr:hypothetical protein cyc_08293 [Cyclospora cayetanensis]